MSSTTSRKLKVLLIGSSILAVTGYTTIYLPFYSSYAEEMQERAALQRAQSTEATVEQRARAAGLGGGLSRGSMWGNMRHSGPSQPKSQNDE